MNKIIGGLSPVSQLINGEITRQTVPRLAPGGPPPLAERLHAAAEFAARLRGFGPANFLYTDGDALFAHAQSERSALPCNCPWTR